MQSLIPGNGSASLNSLLHFVRLVFQPRLRRHNLGLVRVRRPSNREREGDHDLDHFAGKGEKPSAGPQHAELHHGQVGLGTCRSKHQV
jgi:hypothetical protein